MPDIVVKPNSTIYLLGDTGMDMRNSIWWDKYAYPDGDKSVAWYWYGVQAHWFKAHSCNRGYWYGSEVKASRGWVKVGRTPLNNESIPTGESGLESGIDGYAKQPIPYADVLLGHCDYIMFDNGYNDSMAQWYYGFITEIESVNYNVARVYFTIDAIQTYCQYFNIGPSMVVRDMQHNERKSDDTPNKESMNYQPEPFTPSTQDYIFQRFNQEQEINQISNFGKYSRMFVMTDISLRESDITPNQYYGGLPSFKMSESSVEGGVYLGLGVYYLPSRKNNALDLLGSYNAIEHLLYTYTVPENLTTFTETSGEPIFVGDMSARIKAGLKGDKIYTLKVPIAFNDKKNIGPNEDGYIPLNLKTYYSPMTYLSIGDKQGGSLEIELQNLDENDVTPNNFFNPSILFDLSISPNTGSCLYVLNNRAYGGGESSPMITLWQMPSYAMTPNNSGYNQYYVQAIASEKNSKKYNMIGTGFGLVGSLGSIASPLLGRIPYIGNFASELAVGIFEGLESKGEQYNRMSDREYSKSLSANSQGKVNEAFGLPGATGGMAQGFTRYNMSYAGYEYFFVHQRTDIIKRVDRMYSLYGYNQNEFRYPAINTRRRWTFVQVEDVNIIDKGQEYGVPKWARDQIISRLNNGVTFWNVRWALLGDGDKDESPLSIQSFDDGRIQAVKGHKFVGNYGNLETQDFMKENQSKVGGYCSDYTPYTDGLFEPSNSVTAMRRRI